eukprot:SAG11_NODE_13226_length_665_cov_0.644876_1_plen_60_part_10
MAAFGVLGTTNFILCLSTQDAQTEGSSSDGSDIETCAYRCEHKSYYARATFCTIFIVVLD